MFLDLFSFWVHFATGYSNSIFITCPSYLDLCLLLLFLSTLLFEVFSFSLFSTFFYSHLLFNEIISINSSMKFPILGLLKHYDKIRKRIKEVFQFLV